MNTKAVLRWGLLGCAAAFVLLLAPPGRAEDGEALYAARCGGCHSLDANRVGPRHRGVVGRRAGSLPDFAYSPALARSRIVWSPATLDAWLTDPEALIPGQRMNYRINDPAMRAAIIAYLQQAR